MVIAITPTSALLTRAGAGVHMDWPVVVLLTAAAVVGGWVGTRGAARIDTRRLQAAFTMLLVLVAGYTAWQALPQLA